ncbi:MAG: UvrD-helicase domain-containing protein [Clostridia bacterium]|nr:UvrD-helicase domain-containing protein [Clostridia bacterium]
MDFITLRREIIKKYFSRMNDRQFEAVTTVNGPVLVLAGAGSGKTTVLVNRILNLVKFGNAYNSDLVYTYSPADITAGNDFLAGIADDVPDTVFSVDAAKPWQILAITFTNKAAGELKERIIAKLGDIGNDIWAGTFHSVCGKILRRNAEYIGYTSHFTIYDTDDQRRVMKEIMKEHNIDDKFIPHKSVLAAISNAKDKLISPQEFSASVGGDFRQKQIAELYTSYQKRLKAADAMDFDDMIVNTVKLLNDNPDVLEYYTNKFRYVMVDEYQDTNHAQYVLVSLLASGRNNICVVGDDDQSIYRFRGATIENILNFEDEYENAKTIRLEQNYRSTSNILNAANSVIENNKGRKGKTLWTDNGEGEKITLYTAEDERMEARYVTDSILENVRKGAKFSDHAILYRMNAQSNALENVFARSGVAYKVVGGTKFYDRKEIKDVLAYLQLINNSNDDLRLRRIINEPKRGIGDTTVNRAAEIASQLGLSLFEALMQAEQFTPLTRAAVKLKEFCEIINQLIELSKTATISELFEAMLETTGYTNALIAEGDEGKDRLENVKEFSSNIAQYELENEEPTLSDFLEQIALISDIDSLDSESDRVVLMTVHSAKGLEFNNVYLVGMEEGIFPGNQSIYGGPEEIEEERRLAYVAITRAKRRLTITNTYMRMLFGTTNRNMPSRFVREIPDEYCESSGLVAKPVISQASSFKSNNTQRGNLFGNSFISAEKTKDFAAKPTASQTYTVGQQVTHKTFGKGTILSVVPAGGDTLLEIAFENVGTKKIMANFAKLTV